MKPALASSFRPCLLGKDALLLACSDTTTRVCAEAPTFLAAMAFAPSVANINAVKTVKNVSSYYDENSSDLSAPRKGLGITP